MTQTLNDFTAGSPEDEAGPEDIVKHELTQWMTKGGATAVYWEKANPWNHPTFRTTGTDRPDLLVKTEGGTTFVVEAKHDNSGVYRAPPQLQRYWEKYIAGDEEYRVDGDRVEPDVFVIATGHSPDGCLFGTEYGDDHLQTWESWGGSRYPRKRAWLPRNEYNATKAAIRVQWQYAGAKSQQFDGDTNVGIGALLSSQLDDDTEGRPRLLYWEDGEERWRGLR